MANNNTPNSAPVSDVIAKSAAKNKFLDFRNALSLANVEDYAMIHGIGGRKHAMVSGIMMAITDYSAGTGNKSVFVNGIVPCYVFDAILNVCRRNVGDTMDGSVDVASGLAVLDAKMSASNDNIEKIMAALYLGMTKAVKACGNIIRGKGNEKGPIADFGRVMADAKAAFEAPYAGEATQYVARTPYVEYTYHQDRVNQYRPDPADGFIPVRTIDITRRQFNKDGAKLRNPWTVKITNFMAPPRNQENGTVAYDPKRMRDAQEAFIAISDDEMYRCCYIVNHFIAVWENATAIPLVLDGMSRANQSRQNNQRF